ncbi:MAG: hypothetical protein ACFFCS_15350 [Candidatus Hodarchaeota archaeon]
MLKIKLSLPIEVVKKMDNIVDFTEISGSLNEREFIRLIFEGNCKSFTKILQDHFKSQWCLEQISNLLEVTLDGMDITMLLSFNNYRSNQLEKLFFQGNLLDFLRETLDITVSDKLAKKLKVEKEKLKRKSLELFHDGKDEVIGAINHFRYKCILTGHISHVYEITSYLISRLDLGVNSIQELLKQYGKKNAVSERDIIIYSYLLDFIAKQSLLYTTFQSNNNGFKSRLNQVVVLILQYYLVEFDKDALSEKIFSGKALYEKMERFVSKNSKIKEAPLDKFKEFLLKFLITQFKAFEMNDYHTFIQGLFRKKIGNIVFRFFISFLKTSHVQLLHNLEQLSSKDGKLELSFEKVVHFLCDFLIFGVEFTFFNQTLEEASEKFNDPINRFSPGNIALNMVYLVLYRILPFQDNKWMVTLLMKYRNHLDVIDLLLQVDELNLNAISPDVATSNFILHDRALKETTKLLNQWFFDEILQPFFYFYMSFEALLEKDGILVEKLQERALDHLGMETKSIISKKNINVAKILVNIFEN